jgi:transcriptional regulator with XRE-family HTH domain
MDQPNLGKKIAELRQAKGLTQEELAKKCNLSVRTIQRIETAEVTPRSYTIKLIFTNLDYDIYNSFGNFSYKLDRTVYMAKKWPGQLYEYTLDLFNLKTNPMRKIVILSIPIMTIVLVLFLSNVNSNAQSLEKKRSDFIKRSSNSEFLRLFNAGKIDSVSQQYQPTACMMPDQYPTIIGREKIADYYMQLYARGLRFSEVKSISQIISDTIAIDRGTWKVKVAPELEISGTFLTQWHYINGKWLIENEMSKSDFLPLANN